MTPDLSKGYFIDPDRSITAKVEERACMRFQTCRIPASISPVKGKGPVEVLASADAPTVGASPSTLR